MKRQESYHKLFVIILLLLWPASKALALELEPSPAGGGWLEVQKRGGYAVANDHDDFDANLVDEATIEMWIYLKRAPTWRESWVLLHKEGCYLVILGGHSIGGFFGEVNRLGENQVSNLTFHVTHPKGSSRSSRSQFKENLPLNKWHHLAFIVGNRGIVLYLNGVRELGDPQTPHGPLPDSEFPLFIGGTGIVETEFLAHVDAKWNKFGWLRFTGGLIDEVRVSNIARYLPEEFFVATPRGRLEADENTLALWHFDGGRSEWLKDATGNGHTLTDVDLAYLHVEGHGKLPTLWGKIKKREAISR